MSQSDSRRPPPPSDNRFRTVARRRASAAALVPGGVLLFALSGIASAVRAQNVLVTPTVTESGGLFTYDYSVTNNTTEDLALISFALPNEPAADVQDLTAPTGFLAIYDPGLEILSFAEDSDPSTPETFVPGTTVDGFSYVSPDLPYTSSFDALGADTATDYTGNTLAAGIAPEPGSLGLLFSAIGALPLVALRLRRRTIASVV